MPRIFASAAVWIALAAAACEDDRFSISGTVRNEMAEPLEGIEVALEWPEISSAEHVLTTRADGTYSYSWEDVYLYGSVLARVRITPRAAGWTFTPAQRELQVDGEVTGLDFTGTAVSPLREWILILTWDEATDAPGTTR